MENKPPSQYNTVCQSRNFGKFTARLSIHGFVADNSMESVGRKKKLENKKELSRKSHFATMESQFRNELHQIENIQRITVSQQRKKAHEVVKQYSALCIQTFVRRFLAKLVRRKLFVARFLRDYICFRFYVRKKKRALRIVASMVRWARKSRARKIRRKQIGAAIIIQKSVRRYLAQKKKVEMIVRRKLAVNLVEHCVLLGQSRSKRALLMQKIGAIRYAAAWVIARAYIAYKRTQRQKL